jgi:gliding motility-associated-like protein
MQKTLQSLYLFSAFLIISGCLHANNPLANNSGLCNLHVYSGLTPDSDGKNDSWIIDGLDASTDISVSIVKRWEEEVRRGDHYDNTTVLWNGEDKAGKSLSDGTYYYSITSQDYKINNWVELSH